MHFWHPLTPMATKGKDQQGEEEKGMINEEKRLITDVFRCPGFFDAVSVY